jgi:hypothetical protein
MRRGGIGARVRGRQAALAAGRRPDLSRFTESAEPTLAVAPARPLEDWPAIESVHPTWWQVSRLEVRDGVGVRVLIAERRTEHDAFAVVVGQAHQCELRRWGDRRPPYVSHRPRLVVGGGIEDKST